MIRIPERYVDSQGSATLFKFCFCYLCLNILHVKNAFNFVFTLFRFQPVQEIRNETDFTYR